MNRAGRIIAVCGLSVALMMPQIAYAAETLSVQVSERTGLTTVGNKQSAYDNVAISRVSNYVNIRSEANTSSSIVGKIYNNCAATILATVDGEGGTWYQIKSGTVTGYIKSEYFITGADAERIAKDIGTVYVTVSADSLRLREQPSTDSAVLTTLSKDAEYLEVKEEGDFIEIQVDESLSGYVHKDYVTQRVEFKQAVSVEEERQKAEEDARIRKEAEDAIAKVEALKKEAGQETASANKDTPSSTIGMIAQNPNADNGTTKEQNSQGSQSTRPAQARIPEIRIPAVPQDPAEAELPPAAAQEPPAHIRVPRTVREAQSTIPQSAPRSLHMRNSSLAIRMYTVGQA